MKVYAQYHTSTLLGPVYEISVHIASARSEGVGEIRLARALAARIHEACVSMTSSVTPA